MGKGRERDLPAALAMGALAACCLAAAAGSVPWAALRPRTGARAHIWLALCHQLLGQGGDTALTLGVLALGWGLARRGRGVRHARARGERPPGWGGGPGMRTLATGLLLAALGGLAMVAEPLLPW